MSRDITKFKKPELITKFLDECNTRWPGTKTIVTSVDRPQVEQDALYAQGRYDLGMVNHMRKVAGLHPVTDAENARKVTWTRHSEHLTSQANPLSGAFDFGIIYGGKYIGDVKADINKNNEPDYLERAKVGEALGLFSGRHFSNPDMPHLQLKPILAAKG